MDENVSLIELGELSRFLEICKVTDYLTKNQIELIEYLIKFYVVKTTVEKYEKLLEEGETNVEV